MDIKIPFEFKTVDEVITVLGQYTTKRRLLALESLGVKLEDFTHKELAAIIRASREKVTIALGRMNRRRSIAS